MLWGHPLAFWNTVGFVLMVAALVLGILTVGIGFASSYILWKVGDEAQTPRSLSPENKAAIESAVAEFPGLRVVIGAVPPSTYNVELANQILEALLAAKIDAFVNHIGVSKELDPTQILGRMATRALPSGVSVFFVTGNTRAEKFSIALGNALNAAGIAANVEGNWRDDWVKETMSQHAGMTRVDKFFEPVTVAVGDKP